jgi:hypothetical protein
VAAGRQPRGIVQLGPVGALVTVGGWVSWSVDNNSYQEADTFRIVYATSGLPAANDANWFSEQTEIFAQIYAGLPQDPANPQTSEMGVALIYGRVDTIDFDPKGTLVTLTGRDLTACFIDSRISTDYLNHRAYQIATTLAQSHGLDTSNITPTTALIGTPAGYNSVMLASNRSEWDLLCYLAREEGFVVFVQGNALYFEPDPRTATATDPYTIQWTPPSATNGSPISNTVELNFSRSLTVAKGISVTARSPNLATGKAVVQSYPTTPKGTTAGNASPFGAVQQYYFTMPAGKTPAEVAAYAQKSYEDIISHEMKVNGSLPADNLLTVSTPINVIGTGTAWDQIYFPRLIRREMSTESGYRMNFAAQNTSGDETPDT